MPSRGVSNLVVQYIAWDSVNNTMKTGDVANHTLRWVKDGTASATTNSPSEIDSTNAPGVYKVTLTSTETTCDIGTLAGKSSTANIVLIPITLTFEQLPTSAPNSNTGLPTVDSSLRVSANMTAINGGATSGNNATLSLKSLDIQNNSGTALVAKSTGGNGKGIDAAGHNTGSGIKSTGGTSASGDGAHGIELVGGNGANFYSGGNGLQSTGGSVPTNGNGGHGIGLDGGPGEQYGNGLYVHSQYNDAMRLEAESGTGLQIGGRTGIIIEGGMVGISIASESAVLIEGTPTAINVSGQVSGIGISRPKKNTSFNNFMFPMFDALTKSPKSGLSVTAKRSIDGNAMTSCDNQVSEISDGTYRIHLTANDMNGEKILLKFSASGADDQIIQIITQD